MSEIIASPGIPHALSRILEGEKFFDGSEVRERGWSPKPIPEALRTVAARLQSDLDRQLTPAQPEWIAARIFTLFNHYFVPGMDSITQQAVAGDWISILGKYPRAAIEHACKEYLATPTRARPTPGEIKALADKHSGAAMERRDRLERCMKFKPALPSPARTKGPVTMAEALATAARAKEVLSRE